MLVVTEMIHNHRDKCQVSHISLHLAQFQNLSVEVMAYSYRLSIIARTKSFYQQQQRLAPSFSHLSTSHRGDLNTTCISRNSEIHFHSYIHNRFLKTRNNSSNFQLSRNVLSQIGDGYGLVSHRKWSSASGGERVPFEIEALKNTEEAETVAYRRSITARAKFCYQQQQRLSPSFSHVHRDDNDCEELQLKPISSNPEVWNYIHRRFTGAAKNFSNYRSSTSLFQVRRYSIPAGYGSGMAFGRNYSSSSVGKWAAGKLEVLNEAVGVLQDKAAEAADSFPPVAALQYLIDYVHCFTGYDWWASIVVATLIIRCLQLPLLKNQMKTNSKCALLKLQVEAVQEEMQNKGMSPSAVAEGQEKLKVLFNEYGVTPFTPLKGLLFSAPIICSFFFAISNMAEKVPSFKEGGALWFIDLTTPDSLYVFPVLTALTFWITVEFNALEGMEGNHRSRFLKNYCRVFAALIVPFTSFPTAIYVYWITTNLFSIAMSIVMEDPLVQKRLGISTDKKTR